MNIKIVIVNEATASPNINIKEAEMAKERLSKLQKWILSESYKLNILHDGSVVGNAASGYYRRRHNKAGFDGDLAYRYFECWIHENYYGFRNCHYGSGISGRPEYNKARVTVHRAVKNMKQKGLICVDYTFSNRHWFISEKGIDLLKKCRPDLFVSVTD